MSYDGIDEEERIGNERQREPAADIIQGSIRNLAGLNEHVFSLVRTATVADAVTAMIQERVGAVLIVEEGQLFGLFTERDVLTRVVAAGLIPSETPSQSTKMSSL